MTNLTPAQLEEFESTFRHFDNNQTNSLSSVEFNAALASLGIMYEDEEFAGVFAQCSEGGSEVTFEQVSQKDVEENKDIRADRRPSRSHADIHLFLHKEAQRDIVPNILFSILGLLRLVSSSRSWLVSQRIAPRRIRFESHSGSSQATNHLLRSWT